MYIGKIPKKSNFIGQSRRNRDATGVRIAGLQHRPRWVCMHAVAAEVLLVWALEPLSWRKVEMKVVGAEEEVVEVQWKVVEVQ